MICSCSKSTHTSTTGSRLSVRNRISRALAFGGDLILAPEDKRLHRLHELSRRLDLTIIAGAPVESGIEKPHIGALVFSPGQPSIYAKKHLHGGEEMFLSPGGQTCVLNIKGRQVGLAICADTNYPDHARDAADHGASIYAASGMRKVNRL